MAVQNEDFIERMIHRKQKCIMNFILIGANILMFIILEVSGGASDSENLIRWGASYTPLVENGEYYRLFTSMFLHVSIAHIFNNMLLLFFLGDYMERYLGKIRYLILYLGGGLLGSIFSYRIELASGEQVVSAGASGAVFAVLGGLAVLAVMNKGRLEDMTFTRIVLLVVLSLWVGFRTAGVDGFAHLGGVIGGALIAFIYVLLAKLSHRGRYR